MKIFLDTFECPAVIRYAKNATMPETIKTASSITISHGRSPL